MNYSFAEPPRPSRRGLRTRSIVLLVLAAVLLVGILMSRQGSAPAPAGPAAITNSNDQNIFEPKPKEPSLTSPDSLWVVVNKQRPLNPSTYAPRLVDPPVALTQSAGSENMKVAAVMSPALQLMFADAKQAGLGLALASGYRSYDTQVKVYAREVATNGQSNADAASARPGHSEHQTGLGADISPANGRCVIADCFATTPEGVWVGENAWRYGFIIRYPQGKTDVTGYKYEPWHVRYVGIPLSTRLHETGIATMEEYFKLDSAPTY